MIFVKQKLPYLFEDVIFCPCHKWHPRQCGLGSEPRLMIFFLPFLLVDDNYSDAQWWAGADISAAMERVPANLFLTCRIYYSRIIKASEYDITLRSPSLPGDDICIKPDAVIIPTNRLLQMTGHHY